MSAFCEYNYVEATPLNPKVVSSHRAKELSKTTYKIISLDRFLSTVKKSIALGNSEWAMPETYLTLRKILTW